MSGRIPFARHGLAYGGRFPALPAKFNCCRILLAAHNAICTMYLRDIDAHRCEAMETEQIECLECAPLRHNIQALEEICTPLTFDELLAVLKVSGEIDPQLVHDSDGNLPTAEGSEVCGLKLSDLSDGIWPSPSEGSLNTIHALQPHRGHPCWTSQSYEAVAIRRPGDAGDALFPSQKGRMSATPVLSHFRTAATELVCRSENEILMF